MVTMRLFSPTLLIILGIRFILQLPYIALLSINSETKVLGSICVTFHS